MMPKLVAIFVFFLMTFTGFSAWTETNPDEEKGQGGKRTPFQKALSKGKEGRFQAVSMDREAVFILDTKEAHLWVFRATGSGFYTVYGGQVRPGTRAGEITDSSSLKLEKGQFSLPRGD